jgi:hypothetical protein
MVVCEWDARRGGWRCSSNPGSPYNRRVETLSNIVRGMKDDGFEEVTPTLRRVGRVSKEESKYGSLPVVESKSPELIVPVEGRHPSKDGSKHIPL